jgi:HEAT repeat protein
MQPEEAIGHLAKALRDSSLAVQLDAGYALGKIGEPAIGVLTEALNDQDSRVRDSAVAALGNIGGNQVRERLAGVLRNKDEESTVKLTAIQALHKIGDVDELKRVAETGDPGLRAFVKELLADETM